MKYTLFYKKLVQGQPNGQETFCTHATKVEKKVIIFLFSFSYHNFGDTVANFEKDMFRKASLTYKRNFKRSVFSVFCIFRCTSFIVK